MRFLHWLTRFLPWCRNTKSSPAVPPVAGAGRTAIVPSVLDLSQWSNIPMDTTYTLALGSGPANFTVTPVNAEGQAVAGTFDAPPGVTAVSGLVTASIDGTTVTVTPVTVGSDVVTVSGSIGGVSYSAKATFTVEDNAIAGIALLPAAAPAAAAEPAPAAAAVEPTAAQ